MTFLAETLILGLASYRLWRLAALDTITEPLRIRIRVGWVLEFLECHWCAGSWTAIGVTAAAWTLGVIAGPPILTAAAAAAVVGLIGEHL